MRARNRSKKQKVKKGKQKKVGNRRAIFKPINISIDDMDKFEQKGMMKKRTFAKYTQCNLLITYIPRPIKKQWEKLTTKLF